MEYHFGVLKFGNIYVCWMRSTYLKTPSHEILHLKGDISQSFPVKMDYLGWNVQNLKAAHPLNNFYGFLGKRIKNCPPIK